MQFTSPVPIDQTVSILQSHAHKVAILADTVVEVSSNWQSQTEFSVKRRWKGRRANLFTSTFIELKGELAATHDQKTSVNARIQLGVMAYVTGICVILFVLFVPGSRQGLYLLFPAVIVMSYIMDAYVIYRVIDSLKKGYRVT